MTHEELLALFDAGGPVDEEGERTQAATKLFVSMRDYPDGLWIVPNLGEDYSADQERIAQAILARYPGRQLRWPDNGEGSAHLILPEIADEYPPDA